jgi:hypothetical protein
MPKMGLVPFPFGSRYSLSLKHCLNNALYIKKFLLPATLPLVTASVALPLPGDLGRRLGVQLIAIW